MGTEQLAPDRSDLPSDRRSSFGDRGNNPDEEGRHYPSQHHQLCR